MREKDHVHVIRHTIEQVVAVKAARHAAERHPAERAALSRAARIFASQQMPNAWHRQEAQHEGRAKILRPKPRGIQQMSEIEFHLALPLRHGQPSAEDEVQRSPGK